MRVPDVGMDERFRELQGELIHKLGQRGLSDIESGTIVVPDVDKFPGHIACDSASRSEVVVPVVREGQVLGVLDIDSPALARFDDAHARALERLVADFVEATDLPR